MVDFGQYVPPGVYVEEDLTTLVNVVGLQPTVVAILGPSVGYRVSTESVTGIGTGEGNTVRLSYPSIASPGSVSVTAPDGSPYEEGTDYSIIGPDEENYWYIENEGGDISPSDLVYVTYQYTPPDYFQPLRATDFDDVRAAFGPPINLDTGEVQSPLSFAARLAFQNGARQLVLVATEGDMTPTPENLDDAYRKLEGDALRDVSLVVPLPVGIEDGETGDVTADLKSFLVNSYNNNDFRVGILGFDTMVTIDPVTLAGVNYNRIVLAYPNRLRYFHGFTNTQIDVGGFYLAAAYAGILASLTAQTPLTKKPVLGFSGFPASVSQTMTMTNKNLWSQSGVSVTEVDRNQRLIVRHGVTTDANNTHNREISLVRARDDMVTLIQETMDASGFIGSFIDEDTPIRVKGAVAGVLEAAVGSGLIVGYTDLKARQLPGDPSVIEVKFQYRPAYPLNYIVISFSINTETGETNFAETA